MAKSSGKSSIGRQNPSLHAVADDEERRETAKKDLARALQSYINKLDNANAREATEITEIFCVYTRENYASRATATLANMPPTDPKVLFEVGDLTEPRNLAGLPSIGDVYKLAKQVKVRRPDHWPDNIAYPPDASEEDRQVMRDLIWGGKVSFEWLLEQPWDNWFRSEISKCINDCVREKRSEYEQRFPGLPTPTELTLASGKTRKQRYAILKQYRTEKGLPTMQTLADKVNMSVDTIRGIVTSDRTRYSEEKRLTLLKIVGVSPGDW